MKMNMTLADYTSTFNNWLNEWDKILNSEHFHSKKTNIVNRVPMRQDFDYTDEDYIFTTFSLCLYDVRDYKKSDIKLRIDTNGHVINCMKITIKDDIIGVVNFSKSCIDIQSNLIDGILKIKMKFKRQNNEIESVDDEISIIFDNPDSGEKTT